MDRKDLLKRLAYLVFFIFLVNFFANKFYWYYSIWYFDMIMHFLGGFWLGLVYLYFFSPRGSFSKSILQASLFVLLLGLGWEVFEFLVNNYIAQNPFDIIDTTSDIFFDLAGGVLAILYCFKKLYLPRKLG